MKLSLTAAAVLLVDLSVADDVACPAGYKAGDRWCQTAGAASDILYCNSKQAGLPISHCPGRCVNTGSRSAYCEFSGWDDKCDKNPSYNVWCVRDGGPSGIRVCGADGRFPVTSFCDGVCQSNGGHAVCLPEGWDVKCPDGVQEGRSYCDVEAGPGKIRKCDNGRFVVTKTCKDICDPNYAISGARALLVPYEAHHVVKYHGWMQDPDIREATASEPMTLEEEYENQQSWRTSADKLTFIICKPATTADTSITAQKQDASARMVGDVNFFLYADDEEGQGGGTDNALIGEVDVMIAAKEHRGRGYGEAAVRHLLLYIQTHLDAVLEEQPGNRSLRALMVKIQQGNRGSRGLFEKLGFAQQGDVNYFGEVKMVLDWRDGVRDRDAAWAAAAREHREVKYEAAP
ncbi:Acyl-CoA N-acyltransferase [Cordyceps fumosorosea ARSEF 2679]|uniref:Acyl-CoA N-acyltransferase n=1 Tax=Cordyceps fumosorosea (strain ARSEF 2679) TaxID=1081104 RepID=A0A162IFH5_CORFA|nr:Acyl-CoA N-acyltransferase [Cordyceps fumosorosea ARSEF 2679]OAA56415.1 Acyl-CoA N-acyltransferase [Cordyceps fumosorosea ARSEF 2679]